MMALNAYRNAEPMMASPYPGCGISWNLLAGIGRIESDARERRRHRRARHRGAAHLRPALDGTLPGNEIIEQSRTASRVVYARAMGPMQFLPGTWSRYASDGNGDGKADPQNVFDATLAAARYLCSGGLNLRDQSQVMAAILRYNNSMAYARNVLGWAAAYATGVVPVDLPPITGPMPPIADVHLDNYQGLGPGLPMNVLGLPANDPLATWCRLVDGCGQHQTTARRVRAAAWPATRRRRGCRRCAAAAICHRCSRTATAAGCTAPLPAAVDAASAAADLPPDAPPHRDLPPWMRRPAAAATVDAAAAAAELRGVLPGHQPARAGAAAAPPEALPPGVVPLPGRPGRTRTAAGAEIAPSATG